MAVYDIWLCDDEAVHLRGLEEKIARILPDVRLQSFEDPAAVRAAARACLPDILIMDILADDLYDGADKPIQVLYLTAYGERYCQRIFTGQVKPVGYLTKPVEDTYLSYHLRRCVQQIDARAKDQDVLTYPKNRALCSVPCEKLIVVISDNANQTREICARDGRTDRAFHGRLDEWEEKLPEEFVRVHKSYIVNMRYIDRIDRKNVLLQGGRAVPISRSKQEETRTRYLLYRGARL